MAALATAEMGWAATSLGAKARVVRGFEAMASGATVTAVLDWEVATEEASQEGWAVKGQGVLETAETDWVARVREGSGWVGTGRGVRARAAQGSAEMVLAGMGWAVTGWVAMVLTEVGRQAEGTQAAGLQTGAAVTQCWEGVDPAAPAKEVTGWAVLARAETA